MRVRNVGGPRAALISPASISFASQTVGTTSSGQQISFKNAGSSPIAIYGINASGDFTEISNCPASLPAGGSCTVAVSFSPSMGGTTTGSLQVSDSAGSISQVTSLSGAGLVPVISFAPAGVTFAAQAVGSTSNTQLVTLTNSGLGVLNIRGLVASGDFSMVSGTCSGSIAASSTCSFSLTFTPSGAGSQTGSVVVTSNALGGMFLALPEAVPTSVLPRLQLPNLLLRAVPQPTPSPCHPWARHSVTRST